MQPLTYRVWACSVVLVATSQAVSAANHALHVIGCNPQSNFSGGNQAVIAERISVSSRSISSPSLGRGCSSSECSLISCAGSARSARYKRLTAVSNISRWVTHLSGRSPRAPEVPVSANDWTSFRLAPRTRAGPDGAASRKLPAETPSGGGGSGGRDVPSGQMLPATCGARLDSVNQSIE